MKMDNYLYLILKLRRIMYKSEIYKRFKCTSKNVFRMIHCVHLNPSILRKAKIVYNFGRSKCNRVKAKLNV